MEKMNKVNNAAEEELEILYDYPLSQLFDNPPPNFYSIILDGDPGGKKFKGILERYLADKDSSN